jgi:hypothetical protein
MFILRSIRTLYWTALILGVVGLAGYGFNRLQNRLTDGFSVEGIRSPLTYDPNWSIAPLDASQQDLIHHILQQKFHYLAKGTQSFVFLSEDGQYILKFFKQRHLRNPWYSHLMSHLPVADRYVDKKIQRRESKREKIFSGCKLAYEEMQEDTGVLYVHLNPSTDLTGQLHLIDKLNRSYAVDPNELAFYVQRRGTPLYVAFTQFRDRQDLAGAQEALRRLFAYLVDRSQRGILDRDPAYAQNLGFLGTRAGNLDVGNLTKDPLVKNRVEYKRRIQEHLVDLRGWLIDHYPELVSTYDESLEAL